MKVLQVIRALRQLQQQKGNVDCKLWSQRSDGTIEWRDIISITFQSDAEQILIGVEKGEDD